MYVCILIFNVYIVMYIPIHHNLLTLKDNSITLP